jgi:3-hydroxy-9,10-secoandrosta-1,3,5(10)-triene-9,17-dione monooxygenase
MTSVEGQDERVGTRPGPRELLDRAIALRPLLVEQAAETEARRYYSDEIHRAFDDAGFYRSLIPHRYGGLELDMTNWLRLIAELAHGDIQAAWGFTLAAGHALQVASFWEERAQDEIFGNGDFRAASVAAPTGNAVKVDGGWRVTGAWPYSSGAPYSTHYMGQTLIKDENDPTRAPRMMLFVADRSQWEMLDDWGDLLGLRGSGSHTVKLEDGFVPDGWALPDTQLVEVDVSGGTPGSRLHGNPMYAGRCFSVFQLELTALMIGAARGALDEYQAIVTTKRTQRPPTVLRAEDPDYQRWFGVSIGKLATAEAAMLNGADQWTELARRNVEEDAGFSREDDMVLTFIAREGMRMAWDTMQEHLVRTAGSSARRDGERLQRIYRDMTMGHGHFASLFGDVVARRIGQYRLGVEVVG